MQRFRGTARAGMYLSCAFVLSGCEQSADDGACSNASCLDGAGADGTVGGSTGGAGSGGAGGTGAVSDPDGAGGNASGGAPTPFTPGDANRLRMIIETDLGGDSDDQASLIRWLCYARQWDVEGIILTNGSVNRYGATNGLELLEVYLDAYEQVHPSLLEHDPTFPTADALRALAVEGYTKKPPAGHSNQPAVDLILDAIKKDDPRPLWFLNWGTASNLPDAFQQAQTGDADALEALQSKLYLSRGTERVGDWIADISLAVDQRNPDSFYHAWAGLMSVPGFDMEQDVLENHGPLGALYPGMKEGDTAAFMYLVPTGMNDPTHPDWGSWGGRYSRHPDVSTWWWAEAEDTWNGSTNRENTIARWAQAIQNDFEACMDWQVSDYDAANHPPEPVLNGDTTSRVVTFEAEPGEEVVLSLEGTTDPDGDTLSHTWEHYAEPSTFSGDVTMTSSSTLPSDGSAPAQFTGATIQVPRDLAAGETIHVVVSVTDDGQPALTRYRRAVLIGK